MPTWEKNNTLGQDTISRILSRYVITINYNDIPERIRNKVKEVLLDSIGCMIGGSQTEVGRISARVMKSFGGEAESTLVGIADKIPSINAVFANSMMANALDFDDPFPWAGHPGATIIPPALAVGEKLSTNGREILTSILLAYEVCGRIGLAIRPTAEGLKKVWGYGTWQTFGATIASGKLLGLDEDQLTHAFGIAGCNAPLPSLYKSALGPSGNTMVKNNYGVASQVGVQSTFLAQNGFEGPMDLFEGEEGFWRMAGSDQCKFEVLTERLHDDFKIEQIAFKPYPSVRWNHSAIDGMLEIVRRNDLRIEDIENVVINSFYLAVHHPFDVVHPKDSAQAAFSTPYCVAVAVAGVPPGPEWYDEKLYKDPRIMRLAERVKLVEDKEADRNYPELQLAKVKVRARGKSYEARVECPKGELKNPLSQEQLENKFRQVSKPYMSEKKVENIVRLVNDLETLENINELTRFLVFP